MPNMNKITNVDIRRVSRGSCRECTEYVRKFDMESYCGDPSTKFDTRHDQGNKSKCRYIYSLIRTFL